MWVQKSTKKIKGCPEKVNTEHEKELFSEGEGIAVPYRRQRWPKTKSVAPDIIQLELN